MANKAKELSSYLAVPVQMIPQGDEIEMSIL